jgi:ubiquinone/menaquinone biosynthesis C-methylase UbiE
MFSASPISSQNKGVPPNPKVLLIPILDEWASLAASQLVGLSEDLDAIDQARALAEELGRTDCLFILGNVNEIPWRDAYFDVVYVAGQATDEVRRVVAEGGVVHECQSTF